MLVAALVVTGTLLVPAAGLSAQGEAQPTAGEVQPTAGARPIDGLTLIDPAPLKVVSDGSLEVKLTCVGGRDCSGSVSVSLAATPGAARTALSASSSFAVPLSQQSVVRIPTGRRPSSLRSTVAAVVVHEQDLAGFLRVSTLATSVAVR
jgi:hypothetical protein